MLARLVLTTGKVGSGAGGELAALDGGLVGAGGVPTGGAGATAAAGVAWAGGWRASNENLTMMASTNEPAMTRRPGPMAAVVKNFCHCSMKSEPSRCERILRVMMEPAMAPAAP